MNRVDEFRPNYNVTPLAEMPAAFTDDSGQCVLERMYWGYMTGSLLRVKNHFYR
ncbi:MAG: hypothetical protein ACFCU6_04795 [Balneolaceae bacterium]